MTAAGAREHRPCRSTERWRQWRCQRYAILRDVGDVPAAEAATACTSPERFAEAMRQRVHDPIQWGELAKRQPCGHPRRDTPWHQRSTRQYHALRALGASAAFASVYCRGPYLYAKGRRILKGLEAEG